MDAGANLEPHPSNLVQYAIMGSLYSKQILGYERPRVAPVFHRHRGHEGQRVDPRSASALKQTELNLSATSTATNSLRTQADVIITDAFVGNAVLKACREHLPLVGGWLKDELKKNPLRMLGAVLAGGAFQSAQTQERIPTNYGGAVLLGINGICIKAHGASSPKAVKNAIRGATEFIECQFNEHIVDEIRKFHDKVHQTQFTQSQVETLLRPVHIVGTGSYVPDRVLTNADLEKLVDTTDEWITTRSGIKEPASLPTGCARPTWPPRPPAAQWSRPMCARTRSI